MKRITKTVGIAAALALPTLAFAQAGLLGTVHDFASGTGDGAGYMATQVGGTAGNTVGLCSFCHTPHSAQTTQLLWNHKPSASTFTWDVATTSGGTAFPSLGSTYTGPTVKCLSCHDGTIAIGDVSMYKQAAGLYNQFKITDPVFQIAKGAVGGNMKGNHPVGMPYPYSGAVSTYAGITTGGQVVIADFQGNPVNQNGQKIKLYNDAGTNQIVAGANPGKTGIECSSCHDPHNKQATDDWFLRAKVAGSTAADGYICLQCHIK